VDFRANLHKNEKLPEQQRFFFTDFSDENKSAEINKASNLRIKLLEENTRQYIYDIKQLK